MIVRPLTAGDWQAFKRFRLCALRHDGAFFGPTYGEEKAQPPNQWRKRLRETKDRCYWGLLDEARLIGVTLVRRWECDPRGLTASWEGTCIPRPLRGHGYAGLLYQARETWTQNHGMTQAVMYIHSANKRSRDVQKRNGAIPMGAKRESHSPHRPPALWHWYRVGLKSKQAAYPC